MSNHGYSFTVIVVIDSLVVRSVKCSERSEKQQSQFPEHLPSWTGSRNRKCMLPCDSGLNAAGTFSFHLKFFFHFSGC